MKHSNNLSEANAAYFQDKKLLRLLGVDITDEFFDRFTTTKYSPYKNLMFTEYKFYLSEQMMLKVDRTSMANSLEVRSPLVDHRLIEYMFSTSEDVYFKKEPKALFKQYLQTDFDEEFLERKKMGFVFNIENYIKNNIDTIQRVDGKPVEYIRAGVEAEVLADDKVKELRAWLKTQQFDPRLNIDFRGADEEQQESQQFTMIAFSLSLLLMFVLLVTQFNSLYQALLILFAVVMSTAGVLLGLLITDRPFSSLLTGIGIVALAGIVVNNNIVLIDTFNNIRKRNPGLDYVTLITRTGAQRLRPVLLTTLTTIFGLLPLAMNFSVDLINRTIVHGSQMSGMWVPLSQAIVSGMAFAALLTLVATPAMLALPYQSLESFERLDTKLKIRARFSALSHRIDTVIPALLRRGD